MNHVISDNRIIASDDLNLSGLLLEGSFSLEQRIWFRNNELPLFRENVELLREKTEIFGKKWPGFMENPGELLRLTRRLLNKNRYFKTGTALLKLFWTGAGEHYLINTIPAGDNSFPLSERGLLLNFSDHIKYTGSRHGNIDVFNLPLWEYALSLLKGLACGNSIILNEKGFVCEAIGSNLFFIKGRTVITPSTDTGCYIDTIRQKILESAVAVGYQIIESSKISPGQILETEEAFLASESTGIQWILGIENRRFTHTGSSEIHRMLDTLLKTSVQ